MSKGTNGRLNVPVPRKSKGTTGGRYINPVTGITENEVRVYLQLRANERNYGKYEPNVWDCEDFCFLAAADVRRRFQEQPIGIALGKLGNDPHAVNILWYQDRNLNWKHWLYDPTFGKEVTEDFKVNVIIPIPIWSSQIKEHYTDLPTLPLRNNFLTEAAFTLDEKGSYKFELMSDVKEKLRQWAIRPVYPNDGRYINPYYEFNDVLFYWFAYIRKEFPGAPIGVAYGTYPGYADVGALVLWESEEKLTYWNILNPDAKIDGLFKPRVVIA